MLLPDGWYGRPYDNQHVITSIAESGETLTIVLDRKLTLHFEGLKSVESNQRELDFGVFDTMQFSWEGFGGVTQRGSRKYRGGEIKIVSGTGQVGCCGDDPFTYYLAFVEVRIF